MNKPALLLVAALALVSCQSPVQKATDDATHQTLTLAGAETDGTSRWVNSSDANLTAVRTINLKLALPDSGARVTYLLTNTALAAATPVSLATVDPSLVPRTAVADAWPTPEADRFTRLEFTPFHPVPAPVPGARAATTTTATTAPAVGDGLSFNDTYNSLATPSHLRYKSASLVSGRTLYVWVSDDTWDGDSDGTLDAAKPATGPWSPSAHLVTTPMVQALADRFLKDGTNDVYGWVTGIFGKEWSESGSSPSPNLLIDGKAQIHIFLKNLNPGGTAKGVLMGYYDMTNNILASYQGFGSSNEKILFALDSDSLANPDKDGDPKTTNDTSAWSIDAFWPAETVSTLAHEFQHMIHFYQKQILQNLTGEIRPTDAWINEMISQVTEDLVADKLDLPGPRGVVTYDVGAAGNVQGRFPMFNYYHDGVALTAWDYNDVLPAYANSYAFGAWLVRNYGGPALFRIMVQSPGLDSSAVVNAVNFVNASDTFVPRTYASLVREWGLATFLQSSSLRTGLKYVDGNLADGDANKFSWSLTDGSVKRSYAVGSVDLGRYNYYFRDGSLGARGPLVHSAAFNSTDKVASGATFFFDAGIQKGTFQNQLILPADIILTVVVR